MYSQKMNYATTVYWNKCSIFQENIKTQTQSVTEQCAEENNWAYEGRNNRKLEKTAERGASWFVLTGWTHEERWDVYGMGYIWGKREGT